jgi:UDP-N-acetylmuramoylalanine--D-glutamate ligase
MRTLILGTNLRGLADVARTSLAEGADVVMFDSKLPEPPADLAGRVTVLPGDWRAEYLNDVDRVVTSPWFSPTRPPIKDALDRGIDVITEAGFGLEHTDVPFVAVTGTNGKTTVTEVITAMLRASGIAAVGAGNLGEPVSSVKGADAGIFVLELSSFQLRFLGDAVPHAAALLNIAPDHLDWHGSWDDYVRAKARIFAGMAHNAILAYNIDDETVVAVVEEARCATVPCSGDRVPEGGNGVAGRRIVVNGHEFSTSTRDPSFLIDLVAAGTVAMAVGATVEGVGSTIASFVPGAHRRQIIGTDDAITWIDDSKATNPHATAAAVAAHAPVILLAGGQNKGLDLSSIGALSGVVSLVAFGEAGPQIARDAARDVTVVATLGEAITAARTLAESGDTVLLSPGCTSFDEFSSYAERGDEFRRLVKQTEGTQG